VATAQRRSDENINTRWQSADPRLPGAADHCARVHRRVRAGPARCRSRHAGAGFPDRPAMAGAAAAAAGQLDVRLPRRQRTLTYPPVYAALLVAG
jgi:hypothetical protein